MRTFYFPVLVFGSDVATFFLVRSPFPGYYTLSFPMVEHYNPRAHSSYLTCLLISRSHISHSRVTSVRYNTLSFCFHCVHLCAPLHAKIVVCVGCFVRCCGEMSLSVMYCASTYRSCARLCEIYEHCCGVEVANPLKFDVCDVLVKNG